MSVRALSAAVLVASFALQGCAATRFLSYKVAPDHPDSDSATESLPGLGQSVRVLFDAQGVPHIDAGSDEDLARATGYVQARQRFFEMDMLRRYARGRLSELVGDQPLLDGSTLAQDRTMRAWGLERLAAEATAKLPEADRRLAERYTEGVNAALAAHLPIEYRLLDVTPEPWRVEDTLAIGLLNAWSVSHNWHQETTRLVLAMAVGAERADAIYPSEPLGGGRSLEPELETPRALPPAIAPELAELFPARPPPGAGGALADARGFFGDLVHFQGASNGWVVSGERSSSGKPLLANDPHLSHLLPSIVFQQHQRAPGVDVIGIAIPGVPWVLAGHNEHVAWGITSTVADVIDLVVEQRVPGVADQVKVETGTCELVTVTEELRVRQEGALVSRPVTYRRTCHGPLLNDIKPELFGEGAPLVSVRWHLEGLEASLGALYQVSHAKTAAEVGAAISALASPISTWSVADDSGHIAMFVSGTVPVRQNHRGTFPVPGWLSRYEWQGALTAAQMPRAVDPARGLLAHANNLMHDPTRAAHGPVHIDSAPAFRHDRIVELLDARPKHDPATMAAIQTDLHLERAEVLMPFLRADLAAASGSAASGDAAAVAREQLERWDLRGAADSSGAALFFSVYRQAILLALEDELGSEGLRFFMSQRYSTNVADGWFEKAEHVVWDDRRTNVVEDRGVVVREAFKRAVAELSLKQGEDPRAWRWGRLHHHKPKHAFGGRSMLDGTFNLPEMEAPGGLDSVWKAHFDPGNPTEPFKVVAGPVYRMVVDLADPKHAQWIVDTGASGWPGSPHYGDQYEVWRAGGLVPMLSDWTELEQQSKRSLTLKP